jgi:cation transport ATPase
VENHSTESKSYCIHIGNRDWLNLNNIQVPEDVNSKMAKEEEHGNITILCAVDGMAQNALNPLMVISLFL